MLIHIEQVASTDEIKAVVSPVDLAAEALRQFCPTTITYNLGGKAIITVATNGSDRFIASSLGGFHVER